MTFSPTSITVDRYSPVPMYYQVAQQLEQAIETGELVPGTRLDGELALERLRYADGQPLAIMRNWLPLGMVELDAERLERTGLYQLMRNAGITLHLASQRIGARGATGAEARLLQAHKGEPLLTMERTTYNENGQPVELGDHIYRASLYSFEIVLVTR